MTHSEMDKDARRGIIRFSRWLSRLGYTPGTSGNISMRLDEDRILITPTGLSKGLIRREDLVIIDHEGRLISGTRRVTSEVSMHLAIYSRRSDITAVVHSHPPIATAFACSGTRLEEALCQEAVMTVGEVPLARYATTGTEEVAVSLEPYVSRHEAILLQNHGVVSYGATLTEAFMRMETVEHLAQVALAAHQLGSARYISSEQIEKLRLAKTKYTENMQAKALSLVPVV